MDLSNIAYSNLCQTYRKALSGQVQIPDHFTVAVANLIRKLLHTDQSKRLGRTVGGTTAIMCYRWFANFDWVSSSQVECSIKLSCVVDIHVFLTKSISS